MTAGSRTPRPAPQAHRCPPAGSCGYDALTSPLKAICRRICKRRARPVCRLKGHRVSAGSSSLEAKLGRMAVFWLAAFFGLCAASSSSEGNSAMPTKAVSRRTSASREPWWLRHAGYVYLSETGANATGLPGCSKPTFLHLASHARPKESGLSDQKLQPQVSQD